LTRRRCVLKALSHGANSALRLFNWIAKRFYPIRIVMIVLLEQLEETASGRTSKSFHLQFLVHFDSYHARTCLFLKKNF
jgi:hypothetical protein